MRRIRTGDKVRAFLDANRNIGSNGKYFDIETIFNTMDNELYNENSAESDSLSLESNNTTSALPNTFEINEKQMQQLLSSFKGTNPNVREVHWWKVDNFTHGALVIYKSEKGYIESKEIHKKAREESSKEISTTLIREEVGNQLAFLENN